MRGGDGKVKQGHALVWVFGGKRKGVFSSFLCWFVVPVCCYVLWLGCVVRLLLTSLRGTAQVIYICLFFGRKTTGNVPGIKYESSVFCCRRFFVRNGR